MKNQLLGSLVFFLLCSVSSYSQLADGTISPDFNLNDLNNVNHQLFADYLDNDKHVVLDFSATWCGPCWTYHTGGAIESFYDDHGPAGDDVAMAIMVESDASTNTNCLYGPTGCNNSTWGDWVTGTPYPIIDAPTSATAATFSIAYYPTIYMINGYDNRIFEVGQPTASGFENWLNSFDLDVTSTTIIPHNCLSYGSIELGTTGGHGNLSYEWDNGSTSAIATGLEAGDYYVTITDQNDYWVERGPYTVTTDISNSDFNITPILFQNVSCYDYDDGLIDVEATGLNISYQWSSGSTNSNSGNLAPGTHSIIVSNDIGCVDSEVYTITEPPLLAGALLGIDPSCDNSNGEVQITAVGGTPPYEYQLDGVYTTTGFYNNLAPGIYAAIITDNNLCFYTDVVELEGDPIPVAMAATPEQLNCSISSVEISGEGSSTGSNISYEWLDPSGTSIATTKETSVSATGIYTLIVTDNLGCSEMTTAEVTGDYTEPTISSNNEIITCSSTQVQLCMDVNGASSYFWNVNGQQINALCVSVESPGDYTATAVGSNGCENTSLSSVSVDTNIPEVETAEPEILTCVFTNQAISATLNGNTADHTINWSTADGNIVGYISDLEIEIDAPGVYEVSVTNNATGCNVLNTIVVDEFINTPAAMFTADNDDNNLYLSGTAVGNPSSWEWFVNGVSVGNTQDYAYSLMGEQSAMVCLKIQNECGFDEFCNSVSITDPLEVGLTSENVDCFGESTGIIQIEPTGGVSPYSIQTVGPNGYSSVDQNLSNLPAGIYEITVNDSETRVTTVSVLITENPLLESSGTTENPLCYESAEGSINLDVTGGAGNYSYEWSNGAMSQNISDLPEGDYSVLIEDEVGCTTTQSFTLTQPDQLVQEGVVQDVNCFGESNGSIVLSLTGGTGNLELEWSDPTLDGVNNTTVSAGSYDLMVTDENGCVSNDTYVVSQPDQLVYNLESIEDDFDGNGGSIDVTVNGGVTPYEYTWSNGEMTEDLAGLMMGTYSLVVLDANGCELLTDDFDIEFISDVNEISGLVGFKVYPNPTKEVLNVDLEMNSLNPGLIQLIDYSGKVIVQRSFSTSENFNSVIDVSNYASGMYLLKVETENGIALKKVTIMK